MSQKGDKKTISFLNQILKKELTAINQYFVHSKMLKHQGFEKLAKFEYEASIDEMKHADELIERILFLEGVPNLQDLDKLMVGEDPKEIIECDLKVELDNWQILKDAITYMESEVEDYVSAELCHSILQSEEEHIDHLRKQLDLIKAVGLENYLQTQI